MSTMADEGTTRRGLLAAGAAGLMNAGLLQHLEWAEDAFAAETGAAGLPSTPASIAFNAFHAAPGTYSTFTLGCPGASGGLAMSAAPSRSGPRRQPADQGGCIGPGRPASTRHTPPL